MTERPQTKPQEKKLNREFDNLKKIPLEKKAQEIGKLQEKKEDKTENLKNEENKVEQKIVDEKKEEKKETAPQAQQSTEVKKEKAPSQKKEVKKISKKDEAIAKGINLHLSKKHCMYICKYIKNKTIDIAIKDLESVIKMKNPIPFKGEIPHRSHPGMMSGRYPVKASKEFIYLLKGLKGNVIVNGLDLDKTLIYYASATWAARPAKRGGMRFKRAFVVLKAKEFPVQQEIKEKEMKQENKEIKLGEKA
ncbi:MAG: hypothetical protein AABW75_00675 [Nanoarchaeota archaeon]